jgi:chemotaxis protein CheX
VVSRKKRIPQSLCGYCVLDTTSTYHLLETLFLADMDEFPLNHTASRDTPAAKPQGYVAMKVEYINPFLSAAISVFDTMLGMTLARGEPYLKDGEQTNYDISGVIGLSGEAKGMVVLNMSREVALGAAGKMLGETCTEINADVSDAVGELTNMVAGAAKAKIESLNMSISLPTVVKGESHCIVFPKNTRPICIPFNCTWGPVIVEVGLVDEKGA